MTLKNTALSIARGPWSQPLVGGTLTLIPGRKYPAWLRHGMTWGSTAAVVALVAVPGLGSKALKSTSVQEEPAADVQLSPKARAGYAAMAGASMYGMWRFGWWFDEASEQTLRKLGVPRPRVVLGVAVAALYYFTDDRRRGDSRT